MSDVDVMNDQLKRFINEERAMWAVNSLADNIRSQVNGLVVCAKLGHRWEMYESIRSKLAACQLSLLECAALLPQDPDTGKCECEEYYHYEQGKCVPDWPVPVPPKK